MATGGDVDDLIAQFKKWNSVSKPKDPNKMTNQAWGKCVQDCIGKDTTTKQRMDASVWPYVADKATKYVVFLKVNPVLSYTYVGLWFKIFEVEKCTTLSNNSFPLCSFPVKYPYFNVCVWFFIFLFLTLATDTCIDQCIFTIHTNICMCILKIVDRDMWL